MAASLKFFGVDLATVNWYFVIYILLSIAAVAMGVTKLFPMGTSTAIIYAIGSTMVLIFYGYRWFGDSANEASSTWPPTINTCPDYLTYVKTLPGTGSGSGCVDMLGVSKNSALVKVVNSDLTSTTALASNKTFLFTSKDIIGGKNPAVVKAICNMCRTKGLTWEGVFDGDTCAGVATNAAAAKSSSGGSCNA